MPKLNIGEPWEQKLRKTVRSISKGFTVSQTRGKALLRYKNAGLKRSISKTLKGDWTEDNAENILTEIYEFISSEECCLWANEKRMDFPIPTQNKDLHFENPFRKPDPPAPPALTGRIQAQVSIQDHELLDQLRATSGRTIGSIASHAIHAWLMDNYKKEMTTYST